MKKGNVMKTLVEIRDNCFEANKVTDADFEKATRMFRMMSAYMPGINFSEELGAFKEILDGHKRGHMCNGYW